MTDYEKIGKGAIRKWSDERLEKFDEFMRDYYDQLEQEENRKLSKKEKDDLYYLISGIMEKEGEYDERYHKYLLGFVLKQKLKKVV